MRRICPMLLLAAAAVFGGPGLARAEDEPAPRTRTPAVWRLWQPRWQHLALQPGWMLFRRTLREAGADPYPYVLAATAQQRARNEALPVTPDNLGTFVTQASLATEPGALEALAFFLPAELVRTREEARRIRAEARRLAPTLEAWAITESGAEAVEHYAGPSTRRRPDGRIEADFFALASSLELTLERALGVVDPASGRVTLERRILIQGPPCFWGACGTGSSPEQSAADQARRVAERDRVRRALRAALHPGRTREAARALARPGVTLADVKAALGPPADDVGSGLHIWVFLLDQGVLLVGEAGGISWMSLAPAHPDDPIPADGAEERLWPPA